MRGCSTQGSETSSGTRTSVQTAPPNTSMITFSAKKRGIVAVLELAEKLEGTQPTLWTPNAVVR